MIKVYKCEKCGEFEKDQRLIEGDLENCPECGSPVRRVYTPVGYVFKCSGAFGKSGKS